MNDNLASNNIESEEFSSSPKENDYTNLISRLKEVKINIDLLQKIICDKF